MKKLLIICMASLALNAQAVEKDKKLHAGVSVVIASTAYMYTDSVFKSSVACMSVGIAKELYDEYSYGGFDHEDLIADAIGCGIGIAFSEFAIKPFVDRHVIGVGYSGKF